MRRIHGFGIIALLAVPAVFAMRRQAARSDWTRDFLIQPDELTDTGRNPWFVLEPGWQLVLEDGDTRLTVTVRAETRIVAGVSTRVVEERETEHGQLVEVSRNFYAISKRTNSVFYFGEEVDTYHNGQLRNHEGSWLAGENGAKFGMMMPGVPLLGSRYYQEQAPRTAMDRAEIVSLSDSINVPAGHLQQILRTAETSPLEPLVHEYKYYAPGIGLVRDGSARLVSYGPPAR